MEHRTISSQLRQCVLKDDVAGARRLLAGIGEQDRRSIVAKSEYYDAPLFDAAEQGNVNMVKFLVDECHADTEELGRFHTLVSKTLVTPLWCAAAMEKLEVVDLLIELGADINAVSDTGFTPLLYACRAKNSCVIRYLVMKGADIRKAGSDGRTCLISAVYWSKEISQFLIEKGAEVNAQDSSGNTALHCAIMSDTRPEKEDIVRLLIDNGSDPNIRNTCGDDAFQKASFEGQESVLNILICKFEPSVERIIESHELLGAHYVNKDPTDIKKGLHFWTKAVKMRSLHSCPHDRAFQPNPAYLCVRGVNTVEELETLSQNRDWVYMYALMITERSLGPDARLESVLMIRGEMYKKEGEFQRCVDLWIYALRLQISEYLLLSKLGAFFCGAFEECHLSNNKNDFRIKFQDVFEVLRIATSKVDNATGIIISPEFQNDNKFNQLAFLQIVLHLMDLITKLDKTVDQLFSFETIVYRLVRSNPKTSRGETLLHLVIKKCPFEIHWKLFPTDSNFAVVEVLLKCGAAVNDVDDERNTALHLCSEALRRLRMKQHHGLIKRIVVLLLNYSAHVDMVNKSGKTAVDSLTSSMMEMNIHDFVSLKCLSAKAILTSKILYVGNIPAELVSFVQMHGICASDGMSV